MIPESGARYPFVIMNTDPNDKKGMYWWSFLGLQPRKEILMFDSFGFESFKEFLIKTFKRSSIRYFTVLKSLIKRTANHFSDSKFSISEYKKLKNFDKLSKPTVDLLHLINEYSKKHRLRNEIIVHLIDDQLQMTEKDRYGMNQIYFYVNLFNSLDNSSVISEKLLNC